MGLRARGGELAVPDRRRGALVAAVQAVEIGADGYLAGYPGTVRGDGRRDLVGLEARQRQRDLALLGEANRDASAAISWCAPGAGSVGGIGVPGRATWRLDPYPSSTRVVSRPRPHGPLAYQRHWPVRDTKVHDVPDDLLSLARHRAGNRRAGSRRRRSRGPGSCRPAQARNPQQGRTRSGGLVSYRDAQRLADIQAAIGAIRSHLERGTLADGLVFDAVRMRLLKSAKRSRHCPATCYRPSPASRGTRALTRERAQRIQE